MRPSWQSLNMLIQEAAAPLGERVVVRRYRTFSTMTWVVIWTRDDMPFGRRHWVLPGLWKIRAGTSWAVWEAQTGSAPSHWTLKWDQGEWTEVAWGPDPVPHKAQQAFVSWLGHVPPPDPRALSGRLCGGGRHLWVWQGLLWTAPFLFWPLTRPYAASAFVLAGAASLAAYGLSRQRRRSSRIRLAPVQPEFCQAAEYADVSAAVASWAAQDPDGPVQKLFEDLQQWLLEQAVPLELHASPSYVWRLNSVPGHSDSGPECASVTLIATGFTVHWYYDVYDWEGNYLPLAQDVLTWSGSVWLYRNLPLDQGFLPLLLRKLNPHPR